MITIQKCKLLVFYCRRGGISSGSLKVKKKSAKSEAIPKDHRSKESLTRVFNTNLFFSHLDAEERSEISDAMFRQTASAGDVIITQGDEGDNFYIIDVVRIIFHNFFSLTKTQWVGITYIY